jgi:hypothetical protein
MSQFDYHASLRVNMSNQGSWYALLFALIRDADDDNLAKIEALWPDRVAEFRQRYNAPDGWLAGEG